MKTRPTYEEMQKKLVLLESQLNKQKKSRQDTEKEKYYLDQAQTIGKFGTWEYDLINDTIFWTQENYKIFGMPEGAKITSGQIMAMVHPDDRATLNKHWRNTMEGQPYDIEHRILVNKRIKWVREKAKLLHNDKGDLVRLIGITQDITYRINIEKKLEDAKRKVEENQFCKSIQSIKIN